jgi:hypothetical protein
VSRQWRRLLLIYGLIAVAVAVVLIFLGTTVAPCLGGDPNSSCVTEWRAQRSVIENLRDALRLWPFLVLSSVATFLGLVGATVLLDGLRRSRSR